ncbi:MAG: AmmeMemoRadiSam system protein B, partial [Nitrospinota bacterium]
MSEPIKFPKLRPLQPHPVNYQGQPGLLLRDPQGYCQKEVFIPLQISQILGLFDGTHSLLDIQAEYMRRFGEFLYSEKLEELIEELDEGLFLESERFRTQRARLEEEFRHSPVRRPALAGRSYPDEPERLSELLDGLFSEPGGPGLPEPSASHDSIRGVVAPHIDLQRGGLTFARAYKELAEGSEAEIFIVLGTAHAPTKSPFIVTGKDFETPLGLLKTDLEVVERLERACGSGLFEEEFVHKAEHSIELQALFIAHLFARRRAVRFVPILCGSFQEFILDGKLPVESPEVAAFTRALKEALKLLARGDVVAL